MIDVSGSMRGYKIGAVNDAMENLIDALSDYEVSNGTVWINVLLFSKNVEWMSDETKDIDSFEWTDPECTGMTSLGQACLILADRLKEESEKDFNILILSDGCPTDDFDEGIETLDTITSFQNARRFAIAIGEDADIPSLTRFTADSDKVYRVSDLNNLLSVMLSALQIEEKPKSEPLTTPKNTSSEEDEWS